MDRFRLKPARFLPLTLCVVGCGAFPFNKGWVPPQYETQVEHYSGEPLAGPGLDALEPGDPFEALDLRVEVFLTESFAELGLPTISQEALLHTTDSSEPIRIVEPVSSHTQVGYGLDAFRVRELCVEDVFNGSTRVADVDTVLPKGVTVSIELETHFDKLSVELARDGEHVQPAFVVHSLSGAAEVREVTLLPAHTLEGPGTMAVMAPLADGGAVIWWMQANTAPLDPDGAPRHRELYESCLAEVEANTKALHAEVSPLEAELLEIRRLAHVVNALEIVRLHRPALVFLSSQAGAPTAHDVAWLASDEFLAACVERVLAQLRTLESVAGRDRTAWHLERSCYRELASRFANDELPPELISVLFRHAGELGRYPGLLDDLLIQSPNQATLDERLRRENFLFLEARGAAARVRAFDWLQARGFAPEGYDPLGDREQRTAALRRAEVSE